MVKIGHNHRTYTIKNIRHKIPDNISFREVDKTIKYNKESMDKMYDHIQFAIKILDKYIPKKYCAISGTLLGAIRHQGFIPWDDDVDLLMMKKDLLYLKRKIRKINQINKDYEFVFIPIGGVIKVYYQRHCYIDLMGFDFLDNENEKKTIGYYAPCINGKNTNYVSEVFFPNETYHYDDIFPVVTKQFEDFKINCPCNYNKILMVNYSPNVLTEIVLPGKIQTYSHEDFFNTIDAIPLYNKIFKLYKKYPYFMKYIFNIQMLLFFYIYNCDYLTLDKKLKYLDYFKEFQLEDFVNGSIMNDTKRFCINREPLKLLSSCIQIPNKTIL